MFIGLYVLCLVGFVVLMLYVIDLIPPGDPPRAEPDRNSLTSTVRSFNDYQYVVFTAYGYLNTLRGGGFHGRWLEYYIISPHSYVSACYDMHRKDYEWISPEPTEVIYGDQISVGPYIDPFVQEVQEWYPKAEDRRKYCTRETVPSNFGDPDRFLFDEDVL